MVEEIPGTPEGYVKPFSYESRQQAIYSFSTEIQILDHGAKILTPEVTKDLLIAVPLLERAIRYTEYPYVETVGMVKSQLELARGVARDIKDNGYEQFNQELDRAEQEAEEYRKQIDSTSGRRARRSIANRIDVREDRVAQQVGLLASIAEQDDMMRNENPEKIRVRMAEKERDLDTMLGAISSLTHFTQAYRTFIGLAPSGSAAEIHGGEKLTAVELNALMSLPGFKEAADFAWKAIMRNNVQDVFLEVFDETTQRVETNRMPPNLCAIKPEHVNAEKIEEYVDFLTRATNLHLKKTFGKQWTDISRSAIYFAMGLHDITYQSAFYATRRDIRTNEVFLTTDEKGDKVKEKLQSGTMLSPHGGADAKEKVFTFAEKAKKDFENGKNTFPFIAIVSFPELIGLPMFNELEYSKIEGGKRKEMGISWTQAIVENDEVNLSDFMAYLSQTTHSSYTFQYLKIFTLLGEGPKMPEEHLILREDTIERGYAMIREIGTWMTNVNNALLGSLDKLPSFQENKDHNIISANVLRCNLIIAGLRKAIIEDYAIGGDKSNKEQASLFGLAMAQMKNYAREELIGRRQLITLQQFLFVWEYVSNADNLRSVLDRDEAIKDPELRNIFSQRPIPKAGSLSQREYEQDKSRTERRLRRSLEILKTGKYASIFKDQKSK